MKKETPVEWLQEQIGYPKALENVFNKAKEMEAQKQQKYNEMLEMLNKVANIRYVGASKKELESIFIEVEQLIKEATEL